jgi:dipeptidase
MKRLYFVALAAFAAIFAADVWACTNFIITRGASTDGSVMVSYAADSHQLFGALYKHNGGTHPAGTMLRINEWDTGRYLGEIPQVATTYSTVGNMNEFGLVIAETTYGGLEQLADPNGIMDYGSLIYIALQRARTAREAIGVIADLAATHGYASSGESFSVADRQEAWIMELQSKGKFGKGIVWVARRVPDGMISAHANQARITQFPLDDPENCLYSEDVISFARENGLYEGSDADFSFCDTYAPLTFSGARGCEARVWSFFNRVAPGMEAYTDYAMGYNLDNKMPLWVEPSEKISPKAVFDLMRDHYEGTPMDMTRDVGAGGVGLGYRWRPMEWKADADGDGIEETYLNERATATQQTGFWFVSQTRASLSPCVGGILWFGTDDAATSPLTPIYCSSTEVPWCLDERNGSMMEYSDSSMFWLTSRVANFAYLRYDRISADVRRQIDRWENARLAEVSAVNARATELHDESHEATVKYLTEYSVSTAGKLFDLWNKLDKYLLVKYIDGNVKKEVAAGACASGSSGSGSGVSASGSGSGAGSSVRGVGAAASGASGSSGSGSGAAAGASGSGASGAAAGADAAGSGAGVGSGAVGAAAGAGSSGSGVAASGSGAAAGASGFGVAASGSDAGAEGVGGSSAEECTDTECVECVGFGSTGGFNGTSFLDNGNGNGMAIPASPDFPGYDQRWYDNVAKNDDGTLRVPAAE